jgi:hypothetical protein
MARMPLSSDLPFFTPSAFFQPKRLIADFSRVFGVRRRNLAY